MKKLMDFVMPVKLIAGGVFFGFIGFYMVVGLLYASITGATFEHSIPFAFLAQGAVLAIVIALLWEVFFGEAVIKKWRFIKRALIFNLLLMVLIVACYLTSFALPGDWAYLWVIGTGVIALGIAVMSGLNEVYYRRTGERYTELLRVYKEKQGVV